MKAPILMMLAATLAIIASSLISMASLPIGAPLTYSIEVKGFGMGNSTVMVNIEAVATFAIQEGPGGVEVAEPEASVNATITGNNLCLPGNCVCSLSAIKLALNTSKEFTVSDHIFGVLQPYFNVYLSEVPCYIREACNCPATGEIVDHEVSAEASLTTYEGREAIKYEINYSVTYSDGTSDRIYTEALVDLGTLEPLTLKTITQSHGHGCDTVIRMLASLVNIEDLPEGRVREVKVVTSAGDALIAVGGANVTSGPSLSGEGRVLLGIGGVGRAVVVVAYPSSLDEVKIAVGGSEKRVNTYPSEYGGRYAVAALNLEGMEEVEVVFGNTTVALPITGSLPTEAVPSTPHHGDDPIPYIVGAAIAAIFGAAVFIVMRRQ